jgi:hypothetical protein
VQAVAVAPLKQLRKDEPKDGGEIDEGDKVRVQQGKWHGYITARCIAQLAIMYAAVSVSWSLREHVQDGWPLRVDMNVRHEGVIDVNGLC